jgi:ribosomal-protein-alanine N-acetyltransferase
MGGDATARLVLRLPRLSDAGQLMGFLGDRDAMRYTFHFADLRGCRRHIAGHDRQRKKKGFGPWTIVEKVSGHIVGFGGLYDDPFDPGWGIELAYHFSPAVWGRGYASELATHCLRVAAERLGVSEVSAFAHPDNAASQRVLAKAGFERRRFVPEMNRHLFVHTFGAPSLRANGSARGADR